MAHLSRMISQALRCSSNRGNHDRLFATSRLERGLESEGLPSKQAAAINDVLDQTAKNVARAETQKVSLSAKQLSEIEEIIRNNRCFLDRIAATTKQAGINVLRHQLGASNYHTANSMIDPIFVSGLLVGIASAGYLVRRLRGTSSN